MGSPDFTIFDLVDTPILVLRADPVAIVAANSAARAALGFPTDSTAACDIGVFDSPNARDYLGRPSVDGQRPARFNIGFGVAGQRRSFLCSACPMPDAPGIHVLTLLETTSESLGDWQGSLVEILHALPIGLEIYDEHLNARFFNKASDELFMYEGELIVHHDEWWQFGFPDPVERRAAIKEWRHAFKAAKRRPNVAQTTEWSVRCRDGSNRIMQFHYIWTGEVFVLVLWEVTGQRMLEGQLKQLAASDPLTGLWNRRRFLEEAERLFRHEPSGSRRMTVLMIDIDHFKAINDGYGHDAGDRVIRTVADVCRTSLGESGFLARWGGEEFVALLPGATVAEARATAERLRMAVAKATIPFETHDLDVRISLGLTCRTPDDPEFSAVLTRADRALYRAKAEGRNQVIADIIGGLDPKPRSAAPAFPPAATPRQAACA